MTLSVKVEALVNYAASRYEDAYICDGISHFLFELSNCPRGAWGNFDWSQRWSDDWTGAARERQKEARSMRTVQGDTGGKLYKIAADYADTDISISLDFKKLDDKATGTSFITPWASSAYRNSGMSVHPEGSAPKPTYRPDDAKYATHLPTPAKAWDYNDPSTRIYLMRHDDEPYTGPDSSMMNRYQSELTSGHDLNYKPNPALDGIDGHYSGAGSLRKFLEQFADDIQDAEQLVIAANEAPVRLPLRDIVSKATQASPGTIENRADLMKSIGTLYEQLEGDMRRDDTGLGHQWHGTAAKAYEDYATECRSYYRKIADEATWLGDQGLKAADAIDNLQLAYYRVLTSKIKSLIQALRAYYDAAASFTGDVKDPLKLVADTLKGMADQLFDSYQAAADLADGILNVAQTAHDSKANMTDGGKYSAAPFPASNVDPDAWTDENGWS